MAAGTAAGDLLDDGAGGCGQLGPVVQDAELAVFGDDGDDLAAVDVTEVDFHSGDHEAALAGDHAGDVHGGRRGCGRRPGEAGSVQAAASGGGQRAGQGAGQDAVGGDDLQE